MKLPMSKQAVWTCVGSAVPRARHRSSGITHTAQSGAFGAGGRQPQPQADPLSGKGGCGAGVSILKGMQTNGVCPDEREGSNHAVSGSRRGR